MSQFFIFLVLIAVVLAGTVYIFLGCEDNIATGSYCERNFTQAKLETMPHQSPWSHWWSMWEIG
jgi:hypothetical protein